MGSPAFQFYVGDFISDTMDLSAEEIGVYWLLICHCWKKKGLPFDEKKRARIAKISLKKFQQYWENSFSELFHFDQDSQLYKQPRLEEEREKQRIYSEKAKAAADERWRKKREKEDAPSNADASAKHMPGDALHSSSSSSEDKREETHTNAREDFGDPQHERPATRTLENPCLDPNDFDYPLRQLVEAFPTINLTPANAGHIESAVKVGDEVPWAETISLYVRNHDPTRNSYLPEKVGTLLDVFEKRKREYERRKQETNGQHSNYADQKAQRATNERNYLAGLREELGRE